MTGRFRRKKESVCTLPLDIWDAARVMCVPGCLSGLSGLDRAHEQSLGMVGRFGLGEECQMARELSPRRRRQEPAEDCTGMAPESRPRPRALTGKQGYSGCFLTHTVMG
jgi:hypothetical protein